MYRPYLLALSLFASTTLIAQVHPSAENGRGGTAQIGAELTTFNPDWGCTNGSPFTCWNHQLLGISPYMDTRGFLFSRASIEAQARFLYWGGPGALRESSYMVGPRVGLFRYRQISLNAKLMFGRAHITVPPKNPGTGNYFAYAPGGLLEYRLNPRMFIRADYERQFWPTWKGIPMANTDGTGPLTPNGFSLGVGYALP